MGRWWAVWWSRPRSSASRCWWSRAASTPPVTTTTVAIPDTGASVDMTLADAMALWASHKPARYSYYIRRSCFCAPAFTAVLHVWVENGVIVKATDAATEAPVGADVTQGLTMDQLYAAAASIGPTGKIVTLKASSQFGNSSFGQITNQANNARMVQFTVRFQF